MNEREILEGELELHQKIIDKANQKLAEKIEGVAKQKCLITLHQESIAIAKAKLTELDKLKLRHGDYNIRRYLMVKADKNLRLFWCDNNGVCHGDNDITPDGNIFDDLERNSEDLEKFKVDALCFSFKGILSTSSASSRINMCTQGAWMNMEIAEEIHQKLGQLIATAKRKQNEM